MALEHALLVSLREQPGGGLELTRRFGRSIGYFWAATHQQIYRVLARMEADGWVQAETVSQAGRPARKVYSVSPSGRDELRRWLGEPAGMDQMRSDLGVRMRGASFGEREDVLEQIRAARTAHVALLETYRDLMGQDYPEPTRLTGQQLDQFHVLRGGLLVQEAIVRWLDDYLEAKK